MAVDIFMKIDGISGESSDPQFKEWIEVLSLDWAVDSPHSTTGKNGLRCSAFGITKVVDKATPQIIKATIQNDPIKEIRIALCRAGKEKVKYLEYVFKNCVIIKATLQTANNLGEKLPTENIQFRFNSIEVTYFQQERASGAPVGQISTQWNISEWF